MLDDGYDPDLDGKIGEGFLEKGLNSPFAECLSIWKHSSLVTQLFTRTSDLGAVKDRRIIMLISAASIGHLAGVQTLLDNVDMKAVANLPEALLVACAAGHDAPVASMLHGFTYDQNNLSDEQHIHMDLAVLTASFLGNHQILQHLIKARIPVDIKHHKLRLTLLYIATINRDETTMRLLLAERVNVNTVCSWTQLTALHVACLLGCPELVPLLIKAGADLEMLGGA